jgi:hypothetical protein
MVFSFKYFFINVLRTFEAGCLLARASSQSWIYRIPGSASGMAEANRRYPWILYRG